MNPNRPIPRHIITKIAKVRDTENSTGNKRKTESCTKESADFSAEILQVKREWHDLFKILKGKNLKPRIIYPTGLSFRIGRN